jgi:hypothetical protein
MLHVCMFSGGIGSWATAQVVAQAYGPGNVLALFADTKIEDPDLYRFLDEGAAELGVRLLRLVEGRDPWQVFRDERFLGNSRLDPCSKILKRRFLRRWIVSNLQPSDTVIHLGLMADERNRWERSKAYWGEWPVEAPLAEQGIGRDEILDRLSAAGIALPRLYTLGFKHNNCGGFCVKAGQGQFAHLWKMLPARYLQHEQAEQEFRRFLGRDVAIMQDSRGGRKRPLTMQEFRERLMAGATPDESQRCKCACFLSDDPTEGNEA